MAMEPSVKVLIEITSSKWMTDLSSHLASSHASCQCGSQERNGMETGGLAYTFEESRSTTDLFLLLDSPALSEV